MKYLFRGEEVGKGKGGREGGEGREKRERIEEALNRGIMESKA